MPTPKAKKARRAALVPGKQWPAASSFLPLNQPELLALVCDRVSLAVEGARTGRCRAPVVIFDLDDTLMSTKHRVIAALREWLAQVSESLVPAAMRARLETLTVETIDGYPYYSVFDDAGLDPLDPATAAAAADLKAYGAERFFTNDLLACDRPLAGAVDFVRKMRALGAQVVFLSGRDEAGMGRGTRAALVASGLPAEGTGVRVVLKQDEAVPDAQFKEYAATEIGRLGPVVATFDNAPGNVLVFGRVFPTAVNVFVETIFSDDPVPPGRGLGRIADFTEE